MSSKLELAEKMRPGLQGGALAGTVDLGVPRRCRQGTAEPTVGAELASALGGREPRAAEPGVS